MKLDGDGWDSNNFKDSMSKKFLMVMLCFFSINNAWFWWPSGADNFSHEVLQAAQQDQMRKLFNLLDKDADVNSADADGKTALMWACENECSDSIHALLSYNADVNLKEKKNGATALFYAAKSGDEVTVKKLIMSGAKPNITNKQGQTALHIASYYGHACVVELLLFTGADTGIASKGRSGKTPLMYAARNGHAEVAKLLLQAGASPDAQSSNGKTSLMYAATHGHTDVVRVLIAYNAKVDIQDKNGHTAEYYASREEIRNVLLRGAGK